jgi:hypothetical protein
MPEVGGDILYGVLDENYGRGHAGLPETMRWKETWRPRLVGGALDPALSFAVVGGAFDAAPSRGWRGLRRGALAWWGTAELACGVAELVCGATSLWVGWGRQA